MTQSIICPHCSFEIEVSQALSAQAREELRKEFQADARRKEAVLVEREEYLRKREFALENSRQSLETELGTRLNAELARLQEQATSEAKEALALEIRDLHDQLAVARNKIVSGQQIELELRKNRRDLEEQKRELELTVSRTLDEERAKIRDEAKREADDEHRLQEADKDKLVADLRYQIDELKRKSEQGVPQAQGELMELELEEVLRRQFPTDTIEPIPVGTHGGDLLQHVHDSAGQACGTILWESKRTKCWNDSWLPKLRNDQRLAKAHLAVLATVEMPKGLSTFGSIDGVWITNRACLLGVAAALRTGLLEVARTRRSLEGTQSKIEVLYNYFASNEFRQRVEGIVEAFVTMREDLDSEKRSLHRIWAKREKQLDRAVANTAGLYGDLGGILGNNLPQIDNLELVSITACCDVGDADKPPWE